MDRATGSKEATSCKLAVARVIPQLIDPNGAWLISLPGSGKWDLELFDVGGRLVKSLTSRQGNVSISLENEARGVYSLTARSASDPTLTVKLFRP